MVYDAALYYDDVPVLKNLLNIKEFRLLKQEMKRSFILRSKAISERIIEKNLNFSILKDIHRHIFQDLFQWAGEEVGREESISKRADAIINFLQHFDWLRVSLKDRADFLSEMFIGLYKLQPFVAGNYEAIMMFTEYYAKQHSCTLDHKYILEKTENLENIIDQEIAVSKVIVSNVFEQAISLEVAKKSSLEGIKQEIIEAGYRPTQKLILDYRKLNFARTRFHTVNEIYDLFKYPEKLGDIEVKIVKDLAQGFSCQETVHMQPNCKYKIPEYTSEI